LLVLTFKDWGYCTQFKYMDIGIMAKASGTMMENPMPAPLMRWM
jgi:hypothetical protein